MPTDADLLLAYLTGDQEAFGDLVYRHGAMVFGVCTRVLRSRHDAEDAFQATFLVLARRAADVRPPEQVARWLYGVARRTALKARSRRARRRQVEALAGMISHPTEAQVPESLWKILDEEVARLPGRLLSPFVLCDLEGMTYRDAARQLGVPEGTLSNRLAAARQQLAVGLTRRGVVLPAAGLTAVLSPSTVMAVPPDLAASTVDVVRSGGPLSPLAEGVLRNMTITKTLKTLATLVVVIGSALAGWSVLAALEEDKELKKLEGEWTVVRAEQSGKQAPDDDLKKMKVTFTGGNMTIDTGARQEVCAVAVDATTKPKSIDFRPLKLNNGQVDRGIYELKGDELTLCWGGEKTPGGRTEEFKTTKDGGQRLLVLKRTKAVDPKDPKSPKVDTSGSAPKRPLGSAPPKEVSKDAEKLLEWAIQQAKANNKRVMLVVGTKACIPCRQLDGLFDDLKPILDKYLILIKLDLDIENANKVHERLRKMDLDGGGNAFLPWMIILNDAGEPLAKSGKQVIGNKDAVTGLPHGKEEDRRYFVKMLRTSCPDMTDDELSRVYDAATALHRRIWGDKGSYSSGK